MSLRRYSFHFPSSPGALLLVTAAACLFAGGCRPNQANVELRRENQKLKEQVDQLRRTIGADRDLIAGMREKMPTLPVLPAERMERLVAARGLRFGRLTGALSADKGAASDTGLKIYVVPVDAISQPIKAAGVFTFEAFDLASPDKPMIGRWTFDLDQSKERWFGTLLDYTYAFQLPWQTLPQHSEITLRVTFFDELQQVPFHDQTLIKVRPPTANQTSPATQPVP